METTRAASDAGPLLGRWQQDFPAVPVSLPAIRDRIRACAAAHGASDEVQTDIVLAVSEAATNAVVHAFVGREPGIVRAVVEPQDDALTVCIVDDGGGMAPRPDSPGLGLGLPTIAQLAASFDVREGLEGRGTELRMTFAAPGVRGAADDQDGRLALLAEAARLAERGAWPEQGVEGLTDLLVPRLADICTLDIVGADGRAQRLAVRIAGSAAASLPDDAAFAWDPSDEGTRLTALGGRPAVEVARREGLEPAAATDAAWWLRVPVRDGGTVLGSLGLGFSAERGRPGRDDLSLVEALAERIAGGLVSTRVVAELRRTRERLERILSALGEAVTVHDEDGRVVYANAAAARLLGAESVDEVLAAEPGELAARFDIADEDGRPVGSDRFPGTRLMLGEDAPALLTRSVHRATGRETWLLTKATLLDDDGPLAVNIIEDVTEPKRAELRQRFLAQVGELLIASPGRETTLERLAAMTVGAFTDWCAIDLLDEDGAVRRVALSHVDPAKVELGKRLNDRYPPDLELEQGLGAVLRSGRPELYEDIPDELLVEGAADETHLAMLREIGMRSAMLVPLPVDGRVIGVLTLVTAESRRAFAAEDVAFAEELARRAAVAIARAPQR